MMLGGLSTVWRTLYLLFGNNILPPEVPDNVKQTNTNNNLEQKREANFKINAVRVCL